MGKKSLVCILQAQNRGFLIADAFILMVLKVNEVLCMAISEDGCREVETVLILSHKENTDPFLAIQFTVYAPVSALCRASGVQKFICAKHCPVRGGNQSNLIGTKMQMCTTPINYFLQGICTDPEVHVLKPVI